MSRCVPLASVVALRVSRIWVANTSPSAVDDIVQEVFLKLCEQERRILRDFEPRGDDSFLGLLRLVAASVANDYFRRLYSAKRGGKVVTMPLLDDDTTLPLQAVRPATQMQQSALLAQLDEKLRSAPDSIPERDRALFWLYYLQGYTARKLLACRRPGSPRRAWRAPCGALRSGCARRWKAENRKIKLDLPEKRNGFERNVPRKSR